MTSFLFPGQTKVSRSKVWMDSLHFYLWSGGKGIIHLSVVVGIMLIGAWENLSTKIEEILEHGMNEFGLPELSRGSISQISGILMLKMDHIH